MPYGVLSRKEWKLMKVMFTGGSTYFLLIMSKWSIIITMVVMMMQDAKNHGKQTDEKCYELYYKPEDNP